MRLANILGLLGLLAIIALIIIYIIKPNFQQKFISSTFVWKLSLKYKKRRIPISKLRNVLLVLCQILILTVCALILAKPEVMADKREDNFERVYIVDASANMMAISKVDGVYSSRYERALRELRARVNEVLENENGRVTIIIADKNAHYFTFNNGVEVEKPVLSLGKNIDDDKKDNENLSMLNVAFDDLISTIVPTSAGVAANLHQVCYYGAADMEGAIELAEKRMLANRDTEVYLITGKEYPEVNNLNMISIGDEDIEKNVAILDGFTSLNSEGAYSFSIDIVSYGKATDVTLRFTAKGINYDPTIDLKNVVNGEDYPSSSGGTTDSSGGTNEAYFETTLRLSEPNVKQRFTLDTWQEFFVNELDAKKESESWNDDIYEDKLADGPDTKDPIQKKVAYSFKSVQVSIVDSDDVLSYDDEYYFYGGYKPKISVVYSSTRPNPFIKAAVNVCQTAYEDRWIINFTEATKEEFKQKYDAGDFTSGIDLYIFEHYVPDEIADIYNSGIVFLIDPTDNIEGLKALGISDVSEIGKASATSGGNLSGAPSSSDHIDWETGRHFVEATSERHAIISHFGNALTTADSERRFAATKYSKFSVNNDYRVLLNIYNSLDRETLPMLAIKDTGDAIVLGCDLNGSNLPRLAAFPNMMIDIFEYLFPDIIPQYNFTVGDEVTFNTVVGIKEKTDSESIFSSSSAFVLDKYGTTEEYREELFPNSEKFVQTLKSSNTINIDFFVQIPQTESDIFNTIGVKIEGPRVNITKEIQYDDLIIWFAAALVALLFAEWLLQARENF